MAEIKLLPVSKYKRPSYWNSTSGDDLDQFAIISMLFCIRLPNFAQIGAPTVEIWRHIHFSIWRPQPLNTTSGFLFVGVTAFRRSTSISKPNFVDISQIQTSGIMEFYYPFRSRPFPRNRRIILHPAAEFRPNRNIRRWNMTSYRFSKWRPSAMSYLLWGNGGPPKKSVSWSEFRPQIARSSNW